MDLLSDLLAVALILVIVLLALTIFVKLLPFLIFVALVLFVIWFLFIDKVQDDKSEFLFQQQVQASKLYFSA
jgi:hypothetical protein